MKNEILVADENASGHVVVGDRKYQKVPETACMYFNGRHWVDINSDTVDTSIAEAIISVGAKKYKKIPEDSILFYKQGYWINEALAGPVQGGNNTVAIGDVLFKEVPATSVMYYKLGHWALV